MTARDTTLGATHRRLIELGYSPTSASHPDRIVNNFAHVGRRDSFIALAAHEGAVMTYPRVNNGALETLEDCPQRELIVMVLTAFLLASPEWKAVRKVLDGAALLGGPVRTDAFGNERRILRWNGPPIFDGEHSARLVTDDDDATTFLEHAIAPERIETRTDSYGRPSRVPGGPIGSHVVELSGEWRGGHPLETPRDRLPELLFADIGSLIADVERARWDGRPFAAKVSGAAA